MTKLVTESIKIIESIYGNKGIECLNCAMHLPFE